VNTPAPAETPVKPDSCDQRLPFTLDKAAQRTLAIHQMGEMGVLWLERLLDGEAKVQR